MRPTHPPAALSPRTVGLLLAGLGVVVLLVALTLQLAREFREFPLGGPGAPEPAAATVTRVVDGDTIDLRPEPGAEVVRVRLLGVDTPEIAHPYASTTTQCWGAEAAEWLADRALGQRVTAVSDAGADDVDRYGRLLRVVTLLGEEESLNAQLVRTGNAFALTGFPFSETDRFLALERGARAAQLGLWGHASCPEYAARPLR